MGVLDILGALAKYSKSPNPAVMVKYKAEVTNAPINAYGASILYQPGNNE